jgi:DNA-binding IclR family transcriptional regulator
MTPDQRWRFLKEAGMRSYTSATLTAPEALDADLTAGERRGMHMEVGQYRLGVASAAIVVRNDRDPERRIALGCAVPAPDLMTSAKAIRTRLAATAAALGDALRE